MSDGYKVRIHAGEILVCHDWIIVAEPVVVLRVNERTGESERAILWRMNEDPEGYVDPKLGDRLWEEAKSQAEIIAEALNWYMEER